MNIDKVAIAITTENMVSEWGNIPYAELSVLLVHLRYLQMVHQTHHWTASGDAFYCDHTLFNQAYENATDEIDKVAEKSVGLHSSQNVNIQLQVSQLQKLVENYTVINTIPDPDELVKQSLKAELVFCVTLDVLLEILEENASLTKGLDNLLSQILDNHEKTVYLLKQRCL